MGSNLKEESDENTEKIKQSKKKSKNKRKDETFSELYYHKSRKLSPSFSPINNEDIHSKVDITGIKNEERDSESNVFTKHDKSRKHKKLSIVCSDSSDDNVFVQKELKETDVPRKKHKKKNLKEKSDLHINAEAEEILSEEKEVEAVQTSETVRKTSTEDFLEGWSKEDVMQLFENILKEIPKNDSLKYQSRVYKLNWEQIKFKNYSANDCKVKWKFIEKKVRGYRILEELVKDAYTWLEQPWTDFYKSGKYNRHPDKPKRPLTSYMLFYMDKKKKFVQKYPGIEMSKLSKIMAETFNNLSEKKRAKYNARAVSMREEYNEKMQKFLAEHPVEAAKRKTPGAKKFQPFLGPVKPLSPLKMFIEDKLKQHKNENVNTAKLIQEYKSKWRTMNSKKKMPWIRWAYEAETKYLEELKLYSAENPSFKVPPFKSVLSKAEKNILERMEGKPEKPPNSAYSLFSRIMLKDPRIKEKFDTPKARMQEIARLWKSVPNVEKEEYNEKVKHLLENYKMEYATYLDSLPDHKREEELANNLPKKKLKGDVEKKPSKKMQQMTLSVFKNTNEENKLSPTKVGTSSELKSGLLEKEKSNSPSKLKKKILTAEEILSREPPQPPSEPFLIYQKEGLDAGYSMKKLNKIWNAMDDAERDKYNSALEKLKQQYIIDYRAFLKSLKPEELRLYSELKGNLRQKEKEEEEEVTENSESSSEESDDSCSPSEARGRRKDLSSSSDSEEDSE